MLNINFHKQTRNLLSNLSLLLLWWLPVLAWIGSPFLNIAGVQLLWDGFKPVFSHLAILISIVVSYLSGIFSVGEEWLSIDFRFGVERLSSCHLVGFIRFWIGIHMLHRDKRQRINLRLVVVILLIIILLVVILSILLCIAICMHIHSVTNSQIFVLHLTRMKLLSFCNVNLHSIIIPSSLFIFVGPFPLLFLGLELLFLLLLLILLIFIFSFLFVFVILDNMLYQRCNVCAVMLFMLLLWIKRGQDLIVIIVNFSVEVLEFLGFLEFLNDSNCFILTRIYLIIIAFGRWFCFEILVNGFCNVQWVNSSLIIVDLEVPVFFN